MYLMLQISLSPKFLYFIQFLIHVYFYMLGKGFKNVRLISSFLDP